MVLNKIITYQCQLIPSRAWENETPAPCGKTQWRTWADVGRLERGGGRRDVMTHATSFYLRSKKYSTNKEINKTIQGFFTQRLKCAQITNTIWVAIM